MTNDLYDSKKEFMLTMIKHLEEQVAKRQISVGELKALLDKDNKLLEELKDKYPEYEV